MRRVGCHARPGWPAAAADSHATAISFLPRMAWYGPSLAARIGQLTHAIMPGRPERPSSRRSCLLCDRHQPFGDGNRFDLGFSLFVCRGKRAGVDLRGANAYSLTAAVSPAAVILSLQAFGHSTGQEPFPRCRPVRLALLHIRDQISRVLDLHLLGYYHCYRAESEEGVYGKPHALLTPLTQLVSLSPKRKSMHDVASCSRQILDRAGTIGDGPRWVSRHTSEARASEE
jgi:hypothetical protein